MERSYTGIVSVALAADWGRSSCQWQFLDLTQQLGRLFAVTPEKLLALLMPAGKFFPNVLELCLDSHC